MKSKHGTAKNAAEFSEYLMDDLGLTLMIDGVKHFEKHPQIVVDRLCDLLANRFAVAMFENPEAAAPMKALLERILEGAI